MDSILAEFNKANRIDAEQNAQTEQMLSERRQQLRERFSAGTTTTTTTTTTTGTYRIQLALNQAMGMTLVQISPGRVVSDQQLDLSNTSRLRITALPNDEFAPTVPATLEPSFRGLLVKSVVADSPADKAGVQAGDVVVAASATLGNSVWPTSTLEGIQSALSSRQLTSQKVKLELRRLDVVAVEDPPAMVEPTTTETTTTESSSSSRSTDPTTSAEDIVKRSSSSSSSSQSFELTLTKPLGFQIGQDADGFVVVTSISANAPTLVQYAIAVGDRIVAVDSSLGDQLWPASTVEGVISAVTSRLPGQPVTLRLERPADSAGPAPLVQKATTSTATTTATAERTTTTTQEKTVAPVVPVPRPAEQKELLKRCRDVLQRYTVDGGADNTRPTALQQMPSLVADKVVDALASASAPVDAVTLSMIMNAYVACDQPESAIRLFEAATGFCGDGSSTPAKRVVTGSKGGGQIVPTDNALNLFTGTVLLQAHATKGDFASVLRVLAALEGRSGLVVEGDDERNSNLEVAPWPWTGSYGSIQPDTVCYNIAISAAEKAGGSDALYRALELFDRMRDPPSSQSRVVDSDNKTGPVKNEVTYNTMISALCNAGRFDEAFDLFDRMRRAGLRPDKYTYTALIKACTHEGDVQELLYDMQERGVRADVVTYNTIMQSLCNKRQWTQATRLVTEMESRGVVPDARTYGLLMNGMLKADKAGACLALFESACADSRTVVLTENVHLYTTAITAASVLGDYDRALEYVSRMTSKGVKPNFKTLTAVMGACLSAGKPQLAVQIYDKIEKPDGYAMAQGIRALCDSGELSRAAQMIESQTRGKRLLSGKQMMLSYKHILHTSLVEKDYALARRMFTDLLAKGFIPSKPVLLSIINTLDLSNLRAGAATEIEERTLVDIERFNFLLFAIDLLQKRNLPVEGVLYVATIALGAQLGGVPRKVSALMAQAKATGGNLSGKEILTPPSPSTNDSGVEVKLADRWEELLKKYETHSLAAEHLSVENLPPLTVRVAPRDIGRVLRAEQVVTGGARRKKSSRTATSKTPTPAQR